MSDSLLRPHAILPMVMEAIQRAGSRWILEHQGHLPTIVELDRVTWDRIGSPHKMCGLRIVLGPRGRDLPTGPGQFHVKVCDE